MNPETLVDRVLLDKTGIPVNHRAPLQESDIPGSSDGPRRKVVTPYKVFVLVPSDCSPHEERMFIRHFLRRLMKNETSPVVMYRTGLDRPET